MAALLWFLLALPLLAIAWLGPDLDGLLAAALAALGLSLLTVALPALPLVIQLLLFIASAAILLRGLQVCPPDQGALAAPGAWRRHRRQKASQTAAGERAREDGGHSHSPSCCRSNESKRSETRREQTQLQKEGHATGQGGP